jgi:tryptophanyl-tRNA synthetase
VPPAERAFSIRQRVLSGMRPTGRLHIGNYFGALANWIKLQEDSANECFFFVADWHSLTSDYADTSKIARNTIEVATDFLAGGLDPKRVTIFQQSQVPEHAELHLLLSMITPLGWLERVPTYKEQLENIKDKDLHTYGFLGYPVLQTADIVLYGSEDLPLVVPVGEDQVAHVEFSREIVHRFNGAFGKPDWKSSPNALRELGRIRSLADSGPGPVQLAARADESDALSRGMRAPGFKSKDPRQQTEDWLSSMPLDERLSRMANAKLSVVPVLQESEALLTQTPRVPGTDGRKMSKSYGNAITLSESDESIRAKTKGMMTDPARKRRTDKGNPDICPVYDWHKLFSPPQTLEWASHGCRTAEIGCIECKAAMADNLIRWIGPIRERRQKYEQHPDEVVQVLDEGSKKAREVAQGTMRRVREAVFGWDAKRAEVAGGSSGAKNAKASN